MLSEWARIRRAALIGWMGRAVEGGWVDWVGDVVTRRSGWLGSDRSGAGLSSFNENCRGWFSVEVVVSPNGGLLDRISSFHRQQFFRRLCAR